MQKSFKSKKMCRVGNAIERLEERRLLSTTLDAGVLTIMGTEGHDTASVVEVKGRLDVNDNGIVTSYSRADVQKIMFYGLAGGDKFEVARDITIPVEAYGGTGRDTLVGGAGQDSLWGGKGADLLIGNDGADVLRGGRGNDRILGGGKIDVIYGGEGDDTINSGAGLDVIYDTLGNNSIDTGDSLLMQPLSTARYRSQVFLSNVSGYDPNQIRNAYKYGDYDANAGAGQTIYIVDAFTGRDVLGDFQVFSAQFDLPTPILGGNFFIVNASGKTPAVDSGWAGEINLDLQWAHAVAPGATIVLVQADSNIVSDITAAIGVAASMSEANGGGIVSMSLGMPVDDFLPVGFAQQEAIFRTSTKTTFLAASGDVGGIRSYPSTSPYVTSVGGTELLIDEEGIRNGDEAAWIDAGGGLTANFATPSYQTGLNLPTRGVPDVSYNADPSTGVAVYLTTPQGGDKGWFSIGGTSAGAPQWAGIVARINQARLNVGKPVVGAGLNGMMYQTYDDGVAYDDGIPDPGFIEGGFTDIIVGSAGTHPATIGYDLATGIGTPNVSVLVRQMSAIDNFFLSDAFGFDAQFYLPLGIGTGNAQLNLGAAQARGGSGIISGGETVVLDFVTKPNKFQDPAGLSAFDSYDVQLFRTRDGRIYGRGAARIINVNSVGPASVTFELKFEGQWSTDASGNTDIYIKFVAVNPVTGVEIVKSPFQRNSSQIYGGCWFGGEIQS